MKHLHLATSMCTELRWEHDREIARTVHAGQKHDFEPICDHGSGPGPRMPSRHLNQLTQRKNPTLPAGLPPLEELLDHFCC